MHANGRCRHAQDYTVDCVDGTHFTNAFNAGVFDVYTSADLKMDGAVDGVDGTLFNNSFNGGYFSILLNY
ncbi:hypothetical protein GCM10010967_19160 [Dyadobacter beijingensis]|uniref:Uncharacterized protein n=1 Tax=Dyadobacter beijingensis TaxID=365489 RepID=A0ABQ2HPH5_9BACT|nr:hypothetical protein GCM10010967_19160 [Dyadobacter beijingensis]